MPKLQGFKGILSNREIFNCNNKQAIEDALEATFVGGGCIQGMDLTLPQGVSSTIAISVAFDGSTFATTHGDHTVKVFRFENQKQIRNFQGHPRTPWTVRYHPSNSDILASGCLGFYVRVWSIKENKCIRSLMLDYSVISLAFHPSGDYLALASGSKVEVWRWQHLDNRLDTGVTTPHRNPVEIFHNRNIRAVIFHPQGQYLFAAAPNGPRLTAEAITYSSLFAIPFWDVITQEAPADTVLRLDGFRELLPQIHLYSDGGLDVSRCGGYLVTCARLYRPAFDPAEPKHASSYPFSPMSTMERVEDEDTHDISSSPWPSMPSSLPLPPPFSLLPPPLPLVRSRSNPTVRTGSSRSGRTFLGPIPFPEPSNSVGSALSSDSTVKPTSPVIQRYECFPQRHVFVSNSRQPVHRPLRARIAPTFLESQNLQPGGIYKDCLCLFKMNFNADGIIAQPTIANAKVLPGSLTRAVTSTKLSGTCKYVLVGYGVRLDGHVQDHEVGNVACELINVQDAQLSSALVLSDQEDEVNIAQFHPMPGAGIIYGTKRGRTRVFMRSTPS